MKIGVVTHNYPPHLGGLETIAGELVKHFAKSHEVVVVSTAWDGRSGTATEDSATVYRLPAIHWSERHGVPYAVPVGPGSLSALAALRGCDVLHAHGALYATTVLGLAARRRRAPLFITEHVGFVPYRSGALNAIQRAAWRSIGDLMAGRSAGIIAYNSRVYDWLRTRFPSVPTFFVPNGVDERTFKPAAAAERVAFRLRLGLPASGQLALFVGRAAQKKNLGAVLGFPRDSYRLAVCGADRSAMPPDVIDLGPLPYALMPCAFGAADFLVHAATGEGFPVTVQEAMATGLPVALLWDPGYEGALDRSAVVAADSIGELGEAVVKLSVDPVLRASAGARAREFAVAHWSWSSTGDRYLELFERARREA